MTSPPTLPTSPPPLPPESLPPKVHSRAQGGRMKVLAILAIVGFVLCAIGATLALGIAQNRKGRENFAENRERVLEEMSLAATSGNHEEVVRIAQPFRRFGDVEFAAVLGRSEQILVAERERKALILEKEKEKEYKAGWSDGAIVGKADAWRGVPRNGEKAMRLGKIHGQGRAHPKSYSDGYHLGYNDAYHQAKDFRLKSRGY